MNEMKHIIIFLDVFLKCQSILGTLNPPLTMVSSNPLVCLQISKFTEAWDEEDKVDQVGGYADRTELLQYEVQDVAQVERPKHWDEW